MQTHHQLSPTNQPADHHRRLTTRTRRPISIAGRTVAVLVLAAALSVGNVAIATASAAQPTATSGPAATVGVQDSSINNCDRHESNTSRPIYAGAAETLTDRYWAGLHVATARYSPPWDIAYHHDKTQRANDALRVEQLCFNYWLALAAAHHVEPEIAFKPDYNYLDTSGKKITVPDIATYRAAMDAFTAAYTNCTAFGRTGTTCTLPPAPAGSPYPAGTGGMARVRIISPWGEPNFNGADRVGFTQLPQEFVMPAGGLNFGDPRCGKHPTVATCGPVLAAQMWVAVHNRCGSGCTVIAGDFSSSGGLETHNGSASYLDTYARHLNGIRPLTWAVHPYKDLSTVEHDWLTHQPLPALQHTVTGRFAAALRVLGYRNHTDIWLDEVSAFQIDMYCNPIAGAPHGSTPCKDPKTGRVTGMRYHYGPGLQARAVTYLLDTLTRAGGRTTPGQPIVTRIYYLRYLDAVGYPNVALVLKAANGQESRQPAYDVIANRTSR